jgi:chemotaxis protein methyltransferase CheR
LPGLRDSGSKIRIWSAGCSTGEEPYSLAILLSEELPQAQWKNCQILATDISRRVLSVAREAVYSEDTLFEANPSLWKKHMACVQTKPRMMYRIGDQERSMVRFAYLNLTESWPMQGPFDAILCRNVMIYFDGDTRKRLVRRFYDLIKPGGYLFVGHSESLGSNSREFRYVEPAVYTK